MASDDSARVMWPFSPNWANAYTVTYDFRTDIFTSDDGSEQRRALRSTPRKTLEFSALTAHDRLRQFNRVVDTAQNLSVVMPEVTRAAALTLPIADGAVALTLDNVPSWVQAGREVVVARPYFLTTVLSVAGNVVTLAASPQARDAGTPLHPALTGQLSDKISAKRVTNAVATAMIEFHVDPCSETWPEIAAPSLFHGLEAVSLFPNWAEGVATDHIWPVETVDFGRGRTVTYRPIDFPTTVRTYQLVDRDTLSLVDLFIRCRGQRNAFYTSTLEPDMLPATGSLAGLTIDVLGSDIFYGYATDPVRSAIEIYAPGVGTWRSMVSGITLVNGNSRLALVDALPAIDAAVIARISWLTLARFASDSLSCTWQSTGAVRSSINIRTLPSAAATNADNLRATIDGAIRTTVAGDDRQVIYL